eukprot:gene10314-19012_t
MESPSGAWDETTPTSLTSGSSLDGSCFEDGQRGEFLDCVKSLFDVFDADNKGYVTVNELEKHLSCEDENDNKTYQKFTSPKLLSVLQQICPPNGFISFRRFSLAIQIALGKNQFGRTGSLSRSLRPRSFLFAVTESNEEEPASDNNREGNKSSRISITPDANISDKEGKSLGKDTLYNDTLNEIFLLQRCLAETSKVKEMYSSRLAELEKLKMRFHEVKMGSKMKYDDYSAFDYSHIGLHIDRVYKMNQKLQKSQLTSQTSEGIDDISSHIQQLQIKKSSLVKDLFGIRARILNEPLEESIPF